MNTLPGPGTSLASERHISSRSPHTCKLANQALSRAQVAENASTRDSLKHIIAIPSHEMAVVDDVLLAVPELSTMLELIDARIQKPKLTSFRIIAPML